MAELSALSGVSVPTIKYYLREGLLHAGERTSPNQANYDESHVRRLALVRALIEVGGLSVARTQEVLGYVDSSDVAVHRVLGLAQQAVSPQRTSPDSDDQRAARALVENLVARKGWNVHDDNPGWTGLVDVLATARRLGEDGLVGLLDDYAEAVERMATAEVKMVATGESRERVVQRAVVGIVLGDAFLAALRRMAEEHASSQIFPKSEAPDDSPDC